MSFAEFLNSPALLFLIVFFPLAVGFRRKRKYFTTIFLPAELSTYLAHKLLKLLTAQPRPFISQPEVLGVTSNIPRDYSFPSGHTAVATLFAWILTFVYPRLCWLWFAILVIIATSRTKLGLHYPQDIFGGFFLSSLIFWFIYLLSRRKEVLGWKQNSNLRRKVFHLFYGFLLTLLIDQEILSLPLFFFWLCFSLLLVITSPFLPNSFRKAINYFEREKGQRLLAKGPFFFTLSSFLAWLFFPKNIAIVAILNLAIGDSVNALVGSFLSGRGKRLEAAGAAFFATLVISCQYVAPLQAIVGSLITLAFEFSEPKIKGRKIDDNLFIPLVSGGIVSLLPSHF